MEFKGLVERLAESGGWGLSWRNPQAELGRGDGIASPFPVANPRTKRPRWCYVETTRPVTQGGPKRRHVLIADVVLGERHAYLLEIERRPSEEFASLLIAAAEGAELTTEWFVRFLRLCVKRAKRGAGPWPAEKTDLGLEVYTKLLHAGSREVPVVGELYRRRVEAALRRAPDTCMGDEETDASTTLPS